MIYILIPDTHHYSCDHLMQPYTRVDLYKYSFMPSAIRLWNTLPRNLVNQKSVNKFDQPYRDEAIVVDQVKLFVK